LGNISISLLSSENLQLSGEKEGKFLLNLLSISMIGPLMFTHYLGVSLSSNSQCVSLSFICLVSKSDLITWFVGRVCALRWNLPLSFCK